MSLFNLCPGCGCRGPGGEAKGHHRFPDSHHTSVTGSWERGLSWPQRSTSLSPPSWRALLSSARTPTTKPRLQPKSPLLSVSPCVCKGRAPWLLEIVILNCLLHGWKERGGPTLLLCLLTVICGPAPAIIQKDNWGLVNWTGMTQRGLNWDLIRST